MLVQIPGPRPGGTTGRKSLRKGRVLVKSVMYTEGHRSFSAPPVSDVARQYRKPRVAVPLGTSRQVVVRPGVNSSAPGRERDVAAGCNGGPKPSNPMASRQMKEVVARAARSCARKSAGESKAGRPGWDRYPPADGTGYSLSATEASTPDTSRFGDLYIAAHLSCGLTSTGEPAMKLRQRSAGRGCREMSDTLGWQSSP